MFATNKKNLLDSIRRMQRSVCCYDSYDEGNIKTHGAHIPSFCDCKYGFAGRGFASEQTGCPELRLVHAILSAMTDAEYRNFVHRAGGIL